MEVVEKKGGPSSYWKHTVNITEHCTILFFPFICEFRPRVGAYFGVFLIFPKTASDLHRRACSPEHMLNLRRETV